VEKIFVPGITALIPLLHQCRRGLIDGEEPLEDGAAWRSNREQREKEVERR